LRWRFVYQRCSQTLGEKKEWNKHLEAHLRNLDKQKPVVWTGDLNVAPTEKGLTVTKVIWVVTNSHSQTSQTQRGTGTKLLVILKQRLPGTAISSTHPLQEMKMPRIPTNSLTFGGTEILNSGITRISLTDLAAVGKASDGDWITVR
jgi:hypothetical protein